jgi:anti-anti-sigma factor
MPTQITQIDDIENQRTVLRIEGEMTIEDARVLEKIAAQLKDSSEFPVVIDLAELDFMDSEAASVLKSMQSGGYRLDGVEIFLQTVVNESERKRTQ